MRIVQITDSHILAPGALWKDRVDMRASLVEAVAAVNRLQPDLVIHTGDVVDDGPEPVGAEQYEIAALALAGLDAPLRILPGNHDDRAGLRRAFPDLEWSGGPFLTFAFDAIAEAGLLRVVGLDSIEPGQTGGRLCAARLAEAEAALTASGDAPILMFMHHPPCAMGLPFMDGFGFEGGEALEEIVSARPVLRIGCGHVHAEVDRHWARTVVSSAAATGIQLPPDQPAYAPDDPNWAPVYTVEPLRFRVYDWGPAGLSVKTVPGSPAQGPFPLSATPD